MVPHPPFGHLLPSQDGRRQLMGLLPLFVREKVADRPDEGKN